MKSLWAGRRATSRRGSTENAAALYLDLMKKCLTRIAFSEETTYDPSRHEVVEFDAELRAEGRDWPVDAETMVGLKRLDNLQECIANVVRRGVPGDLIETGVWRGGATIFMRAVLAAYGDTSRTVWVADSFEGLPAADVDHYPIDRGYGGGRETHDPLVVSLDEVRGNFARYGLLDEQVRFLAGWFRDTLPTAPIERLAVMRLDGDMYESTIVALRALYPRLSPGGYVIVDDYALVRCRQAVDEFRATEGIEAPIVPIDWTGAYWQRAE